MPNPNGEAHAIWGTDHAEVTSAPASSGRIPLEGGNGSRSNGNIMSSSSNYLARGCGVATYSVYSAIPVSAKKDVSGGGGPISTYASDDIDAMAVINWSSMSYKVSVKPAKSKPEVAA